MFERKSVGNDSDDVEPRQRARAGGMELKRRKRLTSRRCCSRCWMPAHGSGPGPKAKGGKAGGASP